MYTNGCLVCVCCASRLDFVVGFRVGLWFDSLGG